MPHSLSVFALGGSCRIRTVRQDNPVISGFFWGSWLNLRWNKGQMISPKSQPLGEKVLQREASTYLVLMFSECVLSVVLILCWKRTINVISLKQQHHCIMHSLSVPGSICFWCCSSVAFFSFFLLVWMWTKQSSSKRTFALNYFSYSSLWVPWIYVCGRGVFKSCQPPCQSATRGETLLTAPCV